MRIPTTDGRKSKYTLYRIEELLEVRKYLRIGVKQLAQLYRVGRGHLHWMLGNVGEKIYKYDDGYRKCAGYCKRVLPESEFYKKDQRCKECAKGNFNQESKLKKKARKAIAQEFEQGRIKRGECFYKSEFCKGRIEAHHYLGYEKEHWLDIQWICAKHHKLVDNQEKNYEKYTQL